MASSLSLPPDHELKKDTMKHIRYIFPMTENFRERRPAICWEHMYGWLEGYGVLFDPMIQLRVGAVPEWENGWKGAFKEGEFIITSCAQASEEFADISLPGVYVRPRAGIEIRDSARRSEKERLSTPLGDYYYPFGYAFDRYEGGSRTWRMGASNAVLHSSRSVAVCFELFAMFGRFRTEMPERCFTSCADVLAELLKEMGFTGEGSGCVEGWRADVRLDFQAYGLNRLLMQWFLELNMASRSQVGEADAFYLKAMDAWRSGTQSGVSEFLGKAFGALAELRRRFSGMDILFLEYPHLGILFEDMGFFELEWPEYSKGILLSYLGQIENHGYTTGIEAGASCWRNLAERFPEIQVKIRDLIAGGSLELTNGTFSLPYALMSPLSLQYWQFKKGGEAFNKIFGMAPETYQCQENSLTPQMPELLRHFGYKRALHITQNHGEAPPEKTDFISWVSPAGHGLPAMVASNPLLTRKGNNYFFDLPLVHHEYGRGTKILNYVNFQDLGYVPFRLQMIRAHKHAPVWGRFAKTSDAFAQVDDGALESKGYSGDAYKFSGKFFYPDETNVNSLSHYERVYAQNGIRRQLLLAAQATGKLTELYESINRPIEKICLLEAHDCCYVQGQRRGEFHASNTMENPPYSRETLVRKIARIAADITAEFEGSLRVCCGNGADKLFNAAEVPLCFARIRQPDLYVGKGAVRHGDARYASGHFKAFAAVAPDSADECADASLPFDNGVWNVAVEGSRVRIVHKGAGMSFALADKKHGRFELLTAGVKKAGTLNFAEFLWVLKAPRLQSAMTTVVFSDEGDYCEIGVKYAPRDDFDAVAKWNDYLSLEFDVGSPLKEVFRFTPNVRSATCEDNVASPYYLSVATQAGSVASFMNEGAPLYELDRRKGAVDWIFHAACETVHERRMGLAFGTKDAFLLSRAWSQGLVPLRAVKEGLLGGQAWDGISVEDFISPDTLLVSNLRECDNEVELGRGFTFRNIANETEAGSSRIRLKPFEIGILTINEIDKGKTNGNDD